MRAQRGVRIMGDLPIYVAHDSADVWANPQYFRARRRRQSHGGGRRSSGLFQRHRPALGEPDLSVGRSRPQRILVVDRSLPRGLDTVDMIRLDHFRGFEAYWEVPRV